MPRRQLILFLVVAAALFAFFVKGYGLSADRLVTTVALWISLPAAFSFCVLLQPWVGPYPVTARSKRIFLSAAPVLVVSWLLGGVGGGIPLLLVLGGFLVVSTLILWRDDETPLPLRIAILLYILLPVLVGPLVFGFSFLRL
jgi:hypothetical protein